MEIDEVSSNTAGVLVISWSKYNLGFGQITLYKEENEWRAETEGLGRTFLKEVLSAFADKIKIVE